MRTSDAINGHCPRCGAEVTEDRSGKGFVRHKEHLGPCRDTPFGLGERDEPPAPRDPE
jgi:hypothetical protein